ncbi:hypothetical protein CC80DRAFT_593380 [Byssothecium circinans]|uniref:MYND-type domain-containing protein n=1 Tax=Byssothecium circinans TaxID=147558 RepID=A0A6A5TYE1_9PLEO|nr:hypothetical protein CC80DRAFT_593380 [Byssothecium circinans]
MHPPNQPVASRILPTLDQCANCSRTLPIDGVSYPEMTCPSCQFVSYCSTGCWNKQRVKHQVKCKQYAAIRGTDGTHDILNLVTRRDREETATARDQTTAFYICTHRPWVEDGERLKYTEPLYPLPTVRAALHQFFTREDSIFNEPRYFDMIVDSVGLDAIKEITLPLNSGQRTTIKISLFRRAEFILQAKQKQWRQPCLPRSTPLLQTQDTVFYLKITKPWFRPPVAWVGPMLEPSTAYEWLRREVLREKSVFGKFATLLPGLVGNDRDFLLNVDEFRAPSPKGEVSFKLVPRENAGVAQLLRRTPQDASANVYMVFTHVLDASKVKLDVMSKPAVFPGFGDSEMIDLPVLDLRFVGTFCSKEQANDWVKDSEKQWKGVVPVPSTFRFGIAGSEALAYARVAYLKTPDGDGKKARTPFFHIVDMTVRQTDVADARIEVHLGSKVQVLM